MNIVKHIKMINNIFILLAIIWAGSASALVNAASAAQSPSQYEFKYGAWRSARIGGGGYVQRVLISPANPHRVYAFTDVGGAYRSDDGGYTWKMIAGHPRVAGLCVDPRDENNIIMACGNAGQKKGILISHDGGQTWINVQSAQFLSNGSYHSIGQIIVRAPNDPEEVIVGSDGTGIWISLDNGTTWSQRGLNGLHILDVAVGKRDPNRIWVCARKGSKGRSFEANLKGGFFRSDDRGKHWRELSSSPLMVLQGSARSKRLYGLFNSSVIKVSYDGGETWSNFSHGLPINRIAANESLTNAHRFWTIGRGPNFMLLPAANGDIYKLKKGDNRWEKIRRLNVSYGNWVLKSRDGDEGLFGHAASSIVVDPSNPKHWFLTDFFGLYQTYDAGQHWKLTVHGIEVCVIHAMAADSVSDGRVYVGVADDGLLYSTNNGLSYHWPKEAPAHNIKCISPAPWKKKLIYATGSGGDGIDGWFANQVWISKDAGDHWHRSSMKGLPEMGQGDIASRCNSIAVSPDTRGRIYLGVSGKVEPDAGGLYVSENGGRTWIWNSKGFPQGMKFYSRSIWWFRREIAVGRHGTAVTASPLQNVILYYDTKDKRWRESATHFEGVPLCVAASSYHGGRFYTAVKGQGLYCSDDNGRTWQKIYNIKDATYVSVDAHHPNRVVVVGGPTDIAVSMDGGIKWTPIGEGLPTDRGTVAVFVGKQVLYGTAGQGIFWRRLPSQLLK